MMIHKKLGTKEALRQISWHYCNIVHTIILYRKRLHFIPKELFSTEALRHIN